MALRRKSKSFSDPAVNFGFVSTAVPPDSEGLNDPILPMARETRDRTPSRARAIQRAIAWSQRRSISSIQAVVFMEMAANSTIQFVVTPSNHARPKHILKLPSRMYFQSNACRDRVLSAVCSGVQSEETCDDDYDYYDADNVENVHFQLRLRQA